ncbi:MAG: hypothetical protein ACLTCI_11955 [[Clostridium] nexile]
MDADKTKNWQFYEPRKAKRDEIFLQTLLEAGSVFTLSVLGQRRWGIVLWHFAKHHYWFRKHNRKSESGLQIQDIGMLFL